MARWLVRSVGLGRRRSVAVVLGSSLVLIGAYFLLQNLGLLDWLRGDVLWPSLLILLGVLMLLGRGRGRWR